MKLFSQREGLKPIKSKIQVDSMDEDLRVGLWNAVTKHCLPGEVMFADGRHESLLIRRIWEFYFKWPVDAMDIMFMSKHLRDIREYFFDCEWNEVYDLLEFIVVNYPDEKKNSEFIEECNSVMEQELGGYRFVGSIITPIISDIEIAEIEGALGTPLDPIKRHFETALELLANRKSPDYRNSIKESISAVESICKMIAQDDKTTLGKALQRIETGVKLHPDLKEAFRRLYHYTSDAEGIRHGLMDEPNLHLEDARFMLVSCSAFVNYLLLKASKAGILL